MMSQEQLEKFDYHGKKHVTWTLGNDLDVKNPRKYDVTFYLFNGDPITKKNVDAENLNYIYNMSIYDNFLYFLKSDEGYPINRDNIQRYEYTWLNPHWADCNFCRGTTICEWKPKKSKGK